MKRLALAVAAALLGQPAVAAEPGLTRLIPLVEMYNATKGKSPPGDVAWIRCASLHLAMEEWRRQDRQVKALTRAQKQDVEDNLKRAVQLRRNEWRQGKPSPDGSVEDDLQRVVGLYTARFRQNAAAGGHPMSGDTLLTSDYAYCEAVGGRTPRFDGG